MYRRLLKALHVLGAIGFMGGLAACLVLVVATAVEPTTSFASMRHGIAVIHSWLLVPSLLLVLVSGLLAIAASAGYMNAGWPWIKALLGLVAFEGTLMTIVGNGRRLADHAAAAAAGHAEAMTQVTAGLRTEWGALWLLLALGLANVVLAVWRPRLGRRGATS